MPDIVLVTDGETVPLTSTASGFAHGFGLFETMRYTGGQLFFWKDHWARFAKSAKHFALALPKEDAVLAALHGLVTKAKLTEGTLKLSLLKDTEGSCLYVYSRPPITSPNSDTLILNTTNPIYPRSLLAGHKTHNYMEVMHLLSLARAQAYYDCLRIDTNGFLAETATSNLFFLKDGRLHTPALDTGILPGVIRAVLLRDCDLQIEEGLFAQGEIRDAEAVFVTNATSGLKIIGRIDGFSAGQSSQYPVASVALSTIQSLLLKAQESRALSLI
ncbi:MAG: aminotransferase class IV [Puniceicoccaceae bacterium]|nr:aminotransferase class IV [Puniceicoccaceae bacterium]